MHAGRTPCPEQAERRLHASQDTADVDAAMAEHDAFWKAELNQQRAEAAEVNGGVCDVIACPATATVLALRAVVQRVWGV